MRGVPRVACHPLWRSVLAELPNLLPLAGYIVPVSKTSMPHVYDKIELLLLVVVVVVVMLPIPFHIHHMLPSSQQLMRLLWFSVVTLTPAHFNF